MITYQFMNTQESAGKLDAYAAAGATVVLVDYSSQSAVAEALSGVEVVISTLAGSVLDKQVGLAKAALAAGIFDERVCSSAL